MPAASHARGLVLLLVLAAGPGCDGCDRDSDDEAPAAEPAATPHAEEETTPPDPPPELAVDAERADPDDPGEWTPVIQNRGAEPTRLARRLTVQRQTDGSWTDVATLSLRDTCEGAVPEGCVSLVPGAELRPPAWLAREGDAAQCACHDCTPAAHATYRFVARSCDGAHAVPGTPFSHGVP